MRFYFLLTLTVLFFIQCDAPSSSDMDTTEPSASMTNSDSPLSSRHNILQDSIDRYFKRYTNDNIVQESPLIIKIAGTSQVLPCEESFSQTEFNDCAVASAYLAAQRLQTILSEVCPKETKDQLIFLQQLLTDLHQIEQAALTAGSKYEGGSMQPMVIHAERRAGLIRLATALSKSNTTAPK